MTALSVTFPYSYFLDKNGSPLENGYIYVGEPGKDAESAPVEVYTKVDNDGTLRGQIDQPIRTSNGYMILSGSPIQAYVKDINYSLKVKNAFGEVLTNEYRANTIFGQGIASSDDQLSWEKVAVIECLGTSGSTLPTQMDYVHDIYGQYGGGFYYLIMQRYGSCSSDASRTWQMLFVDSDMPEISFSHLVHIGLDGRFKIIFNCKSFRFGLSAYYAGKTYRWDLYRLSSV